MPYAIEVSPAAERELRGLPVTVQDKIRPVIRALANEPRPSGVVKMQGRDHTYRVRSGDYRIVYEIHDAVLQILIVRIANRRDVYRQR